MFTNAGKTAKNACAADTVTALPTKMRKYDPFQKDEKFFEKVLDNFAASGIITIVPGAAVQEHNRICGYGGIGRRVRFRF